MKSVYISSTQAWLISEVGEETEKEHRKQQQREEGEALGKRERECRLGERKTMALVKRHKLHTYLQNSTIAGRNLVHIG